MIDHKKGIRSMLTSQGTTHLFARYPTQPDMDGPMMVVVANQGVMEEIYIGIYKL